MLACELGRSGMAADKALPRPASWHWCRLTIWAAGPTTIPTGEHLKAALRDRAIWDEFNGRNIDSWPVSTASPCRRLMR
ncbi:Mor transcription activator family protein [Aeromonas sp. FDAARGOS 1402]|uniref:Mor transcription activator family protein n=1 Tax=Aeromonas sp. FDAARGOS 1402 TaxID=2778051 RepID=UPI001C221744|nr:hypothetical protein I6L32_22655 [Aeromonas sp. FDAARGOS 1402]